MDMNWALGDTLRDTWSGFEGVCDGRHSFMSGTIQLSLKPKKLDDKGRPAEPALFDWQQLQRVEEGQGEAPSTMPVFQFGDQVSETVTDFTGVVVSKHEYINGCVNYGVQPQALIKGDLAKPRLLNCQVMILGGRISNPKPLPSAGGPEIMPV